MITKKLIGARIKELRTMRRFTQSQLSEMVEIDPSHLSRVEIGSSYPSFGLLGKMAVSLNVEFKDFFEFTPAPSTMKDVKKEINLLIKEADDIYKLRLILKFLRSVFR